MKNEPSKWVHPVHARGVKSQNISGLFRGSVLTDSQIHTYALQGKYGDAARLRAEAADRLRVTRGKKAQRQVKTSLSETIKDLLDDLTN